MGVSFMRTSLYLFLFIAFLVGDTAAEGPLSDPGIPDGETIIYTVHEKEEESAVRQEIRRVSDGGGAFYKVFSWSDERDYELTLRAADMVTLRSASRSRVNGADYSSETVLYQLPAIAGDEILVLNSQELLYMLRGYPFASPRDLKIRFIGQSGNDSPFSLEVRFVKEERVTIEDRQIAAYKLKLDVRLSGILKLVAGLFPKTYFWYSVETPHYLVRYEGSAGGIGGGDDQIIEIASYSG